MCVCDAVLFHVHCFSLVTLVITNHPEDKNVSLSDEFVMLYCSAAGFPSPTHIIWFHNGSQVQSIAHAFNEVIKNHTIASTLVIPLVGGNSTGSYFCRATTTHKAVESNSAFVFVQGK